MIRQSCNARQDKKKYEMILKYRTVIPKFPTQILCQLLTVFLFYRGCRTKSNPFPAKVGHINFLSSKKRSNNFVIWFEQSA